MSTDQNKYDYILQRLSSLESRIAEIEVYLHLRPGAVSQKSRAVATDAGSEEGQSLEHTIGEFWLAQVGAILIMLGVAFFISYPIPGVPAIAASFLGYLAVMAVLSLSKYWEKNYVYLSRILFGGGLLLIYFATLRLHFYSTNPVITSNTLGVVLIFVALISTIVIAIKRASAFVTIMILLLSLYSGLISKNDYLFLSVLVLTGLTLLWLLVKYDWQGTVITGMIFIFTAHLIWLSNNPVAGNTLQPAIHHKFNLLFLMIYATGFALVNQFRQDKKHTDFFEILITMINSMGVFVIGLVNVLFFFQKESALLGLLTFIYFITIATVNFKHSKNNYSTSIYASFGFVALSYSIFSQFNAPDYYVGLGLQSLLVIVFAIWFRSRLIIVANVVIFMLIYLSYLGFSESNGWVNLSYTVSALASARILNWKKSA